MIFAFSLFVVVGIELRLKVSKIEISLQKWPSYGPAPDDLGQHDRRYRGLHVNLTESRWMGCECYEVLK
jgi:hypothetical protein